MGRKLVFYGEVVSEDTAGKVPKLSVFTASNDIDMQLELEKAIRNFMASKGWKEAP